MEKTVRVLFIVYRTEWWGCLDSLCREACREEGTVCYVMPVPRYDRDIVTREADPARRHYCPKLPAGMLPEGAFLADYREFSMEQGFDRIYIHNPYDNSGVLDTVDAAYYSWNLRKYTRQLIYVPHLLYIDWIPQQYANCPVYNYVDTILLPGERARYSLEEQYDEKVRIVPSGIPEYLERLKEADGQRTADARRKLLFCLSFDDLFYGTEKQLRKMRDIFEYLKSREEILLIFRPDEDIRARYSELQPSVREQYEGLLKYFTECGIGILDDTSDIYRTAAEADGILSAGHPMEPLFLVQGKYALRIDRVQRPIPSDEVRCIPFMWALSVTEREHEIELWFVPLMTRLLCRMIIQKDAAGDIMGEDLRNAGERQRLPENGKVEIIAEIPDEIIRGLNYIDMIKVGNCLYLAPGASDGIWKYDLNTNSFSKHYLPDAEGMCIAKLFSYGRYLYFVPRCFPGIIKYDIEKEDIEIIDGWVKEMEKYVLPECRKEFYFLWAVKQENHMLYMASSKCDVWLEFDMGSDTWKLRPINLAGRRFASMVKDGEKVWLFPCSGEDVVLWNCLTGDAKIVYTASCEDSRDTPYVSGIDMGDRIIAFPQTAGNLLIMSKEKPEEIVEITEGLPCRKQDYLSEYQRQRKIGYQFVKKMQDGRILSYEYYDGAFLLLNDRLQVTDKIYCRLPLEAVRRQQDIIWNYEQCRFEFNGVLHEAYFLPAMIDYFVWHGGERQEAICGCYGKRLLQGLDYFKK